MTCRGGITFRGFSTKGKFMKSIHHSFDIFLAEKYGIREAILIHHFQHWINVNINLKRNLHEARYWTYQTIEEITAHFPYMSKFEVSEILQKLIRGRSRRSKKGPAFEPVLMKGNFNKTGFDKTIWYSFVDQKMFTKLANAKMEKGKCQNGQQQLPSPIPDTIPHTETNLPPPASSGESSKQVMRRRKISLGWSVFEFEECWKRYLSQKTGSVKNIEKWLDKVVQSVRVEKEAIEELEKIRKVEKDLCDKKIKEEENTRQKVESETVSRNELVIAKNKNLADQFMKKYPQNSFICTDKYFKFLIPMYGESVGVLAWDDEYLGKVLDFFLWEKLLNS